MKQRNEPSRNVPKYASQASYLLTFVFIGNGMKYLYILLYVEIRSALTKVFITFLYK